MVWSVVVVTNISGNFLLLVKLNTYQREHGEKKASASKY